MPYNRARHPYPPVRKSHLVSSYVVGLTLLLAGVGFGMLLCDRQPVVPAAQVVIPAFVQPAPPTSKPLVHKKPVHAHKKPAAQATVPMPSSPIARSLAQPGKVWEPQTP